MMSLAPTETLAPILNASTRCDRCGSRAYVVVILRWSPKLRQGGELLFCSHHYTKHELALMPIVTQVIDERFQLSRHIADDKHIV